MPYPTAQNNNKPKKSYLKRRSDYLKTYKGMCIRRQFLSLYVIPNDSGAHRLGFTATKKVGVAVLRNRFRRWSKEFYRKRDLPLDRPTDFHIVVGNKRWAKDEFKKIDYESFINELEEAFKTSLSRRR